MKTLAFTLALVACADSSKSDADYRADVAAAMQVLIAPYLADFRQAVAELQTVAPSRAWNPTADDAAIAAMREAWKRSRLMYEHIEGAVEPMFTDLNVTMDARYDDYLARIGSTGDHDLFDATGVTGMHGIERILYARDIRPQVIAFESALSGYEAPAYPVTEDQARAFKTALVQKLIDDSATLRARWESGAIDVTAVFEGLIGVMHEQLAKVDLAATGQEESRYANVTLFDLRSNLEGTRMLYELFRPWIRSKPTGIDADEAIEAKFAALALVYVSAPGDALPTPPSDWNPAQPSQADLATPFGKMWLHVHEDVDPHRAGSVVFEMNLVAGLLGFPPFTEEL